VADDQTNALPRVVVLLRSARSHQAAPGHFGQVSPPEKRIRRWWGA
jgi:hypothetical protein